ncbi:hypothetical protein [Bythopirellula polymerisocia]|nr:hypothetical protein [Bythopirellula polymerisocia]
MSESHENLNIDPKVPLHEKALELADSIDRFGDILLKQWNIEEWLRENPLANTLTSKDVADTLGRCFAWAESCVPHEEGVRFKKRINGFLDFVIKVEEQCQKRISTFTSEVGLSGQRLGGETVWKCTENQRIYLNLAVTHTSETLRVWANTMREKASETPPIPDGPLPGFRWGKNGEIIAEQLQPAVWKMLDHLWNVDCRVAAFDQLKQPIYDDSEHIADAGAFGSLRKKANAYFLKHEIPYKVSIKQASVILSPAD